MGVCIFRAIYVAYTYRQFIFLRAVEQSANCAFIFYCRGVRSVDMSRAARAA